MSTKPIGIFDSGVGGTSIWNELHLRLPNEHTLYLADSKNSPYGTKTQQEIIELSIKNTEYLISKNCKLIVVACNTATTSAIKVLRERFNIPLIGIEPAIKPAALNTKTKAIGILATRGTLSSELFHQTTDLYNDKIRVIEQEGEGIVQLIESGKLDSVEMTTLLKLYLQPMIQANIDYLVLGCTHYPYLMPQLLKILPKEVKIIDSGRAVAKQTELILNKNKLLNISGKKPETHFYTNADTQVISQILGDAYKDHISYLDF
ncbi:glutamate racemase [Bizionia argentinensis JUB59]|uniref:Glutamate racemase n=1 Tax=Bizionia argentinensis JUB59 TaxID=1046627 RepID=G2EFV6_9FLAO|nr:glutamate racemase [Bizionia argentinensis]EGV42701.1 glutamate racemase [Bizionia argentinensis JUB59]